MSNDEVLHIEAASALTFQTSALTLLQNATLLFFWMAHFSTATLFSTLLVSLRCRVVGQMLVQPLGELHSIRPLCHDSSPQNTTKQLKISSHGSAQFKKIPGYLSSKLPSNPFDNDSNGFRVSCFP
jgi:hypothetical protein